MNKGKENVAETDRKTLSLNYEDFSALIHKIHQSQEYYGP